MLRDWIRALYDREIRYLELLDLADKIEEILKVSTARGLEFSRRAWQKTKTSLAWTGILFVAFLVVTIIAAIVWLIPFQKPIWLAQLLIAVPGFLWAAVLFFVVLLLSAVKVLISQVEGIESLWDQFKAAISSYMKVPALIALVTIILMLVVARVPSMTGIPSLLPSALLVMLGFGLVAFLGVSRAGVNWMKRAVVVQLVLTLLFLVVLMLGPLFPNFLEKVRNSPRQLDEVFKPLPPEEAEIDVNNPPVPFDSLGNSLYSYTTNENGAFRIWKKPHSPRLVDPHNKQPLKPVESLAQWNAIITSLRERSPAPETASAHKPPRLIPVTDPDKIQFVDSVTGSNKVWYVKLDDGRFELYDGRGYHRSGRELLPADSPAIREEIKNSFSNEQLRQEQLKQAREKTASQPTPTQSPAIQVPEQFTSVPPARETAASPEEATYTTAAQERVAKELLEIDRFQFALHYHLDCVGLSYQNPPTIKAVFRLASIGREPAAREYQVVEHFRSREWFGVVAPQTIEKITSKLVEMLKADPEAIKLLQATTR
jgi:hypothetical protein